jgi:hypothetical protein
MEEDPGNDIRAKALREKLREGGGSWRKTNARAALSPFALYLTSRATSKDLSTRAPNSPMTRLDFPPNSSLLLIDREKKN